MKRLAIIALLGLGGCNPTSGVMEVGPGRYRVTQEAVYTQSSAETSLVEQANRFCGERGLRPDLRIQSGQPATSWSYAAASGEFTCIAR